MSKILVSCEMPIYLEQFCLGLHAASGIQFVPIAIFMSLHAPAGACILVASASLIHVFPVQHVLKHCGVHKHSLFIYIYIYIYIYIQHVIQNNHRTPQLAGEACQLGCKNECPIVPLSNIAMCDT